MRKCRGALYGARRMEDTKELKGGERMGRGAEKKILSFLVTLNSRVKTQSTLLYRYAMTSLI